MTKATTKSIGVGFIGTGGMGTRHAVNLHKYVGGAHVAAVYDLDKRHAEDAAAQTGNPEIFDDPYKLIKSKAVDALILASPDDTHSPLTLACLKAGKPVLCEKPLATTVADAVKVLNAEVKLGKRLVSVGFMRRFDPQHLAVYNAAHSGQLGNPILVKGVHRNASQAYGVLGSTILTNSAGHDIDSARWLLGGEVTEVSVRGLRSSDSVHPETKDMLILQLAFDNNRMAVAEVFVNAGYGYEVSAEVVCERGTAVTTQPDLALVRNSANRGYYVPSDWLSRFQEGYIAELQDWVNTLTAGQIFSGASAWDGYVTMMVTSACIKSLQTAKTVPVQLIAKPELYQ